MISDRSIDALATSIDRGGGVDDSNRDILVAALRIAGRVTRPGVIERALGPQQPVKFRHGELKVIENKADTIRKALTDG